MFKRLVFAFASFGPVAFRQLREFGTGQEALVVGNTKNGCFSSLHSQTSLNDVVGLNLASHDLPFRLPAGELLSLMDLCAARAAMTHIGQALNNSKAGQSQPNEVSVATVAATEMRFRFPIIHGDMANVTGTVVNVGKTSLTVELNVWRTQFPTRAKKCVGRAFFFMVAIDKQLRTIPIVPALELAPEHEQKHRDAQRVKQAQQAIDLKLDEALTTAESLKGEDIETEINKRKKHNVPFEETVIKASRLFFPGHLNLNNSIFGGEILRWMELHACHCGRLFTRNKRVYSIAMHEIVFSRPIMIDDWVSLEAAVVFVQNTTMVVNVKVFIDSPCGARVVTNEASFVLTNFDDIGHGQAIETGLDLHNAGLEWRKQYMAAKYRNEHRVADKVHAPHKRSSGSP